MSGPPPTAPSSKEKASGLVSGSVSMTQSGGKRGIPLIKPGSEEDGMQKNEDRKKPPKTGISFKEGTKTENAAGGGSFKAGGSFSMGVSGSFRDGSRRSLMMIKHASSKTIGVAEAIVSEVAQGPVAPNKRPRSINKGESTVRDT